MMNIPKPAAISLAPAPALSHSDAQLIMARARPLYEELERRGVAGQIQSMGARLDAATGSPYVFIDLSASLNVELGELPQTCDGLCVRYSKEPPFIG